MTKHTHLYPTGRGFSQVVIASGDRHIFISGQCAMDLNGQLVGEGDIALQTEQILKNISQGLSEAGASMDDLVRMTIYVVDYDELKREAMQAVRDRFISSDKGPASTLIGVSRFQANRLLVRNWCARIKYLSTQYLQITVSILAFVVLRRIVRT